jgi:hypothetical protein
MNPNNSITQVARVIVKIEQRDSQYFKTIPKKYTERFTHPPSAPGSTSETALPAYHV